MDICVLTAERNIFVDDQYSHTLGWSVFNLKEKTAGVFIQSLE